ncbi:MAG: cyclic pyranopterin monophosphate synthase MoaC [Acidobacteriota bacterium]
MSRQFESSADPSAGPAFSHLDAEGRARMVDVSSKPVTRRVAEAACRVLLEPSTVERLSSLPKGDAVTVARLAGIQAAKRVDELVPLAHTLAPDHVDIEIEPAEGGVEIRSRIVVVARTGAEIEALAACSNAALALYDMVKAVEKGAVITDLRLVAKRGGRSGDYKRADDGQPVDEGGA